MAGTWRSRCFVLRSRTTLIGWRVSAAKRTCSPLSITRRSRAIYGFEEVNGTAFLILELVEGEDLAERLRRGPLPMQDALDIAKQIAEALEAAHERGVIHRDLKPANVKVTAAGTAKVLDFGLAKAWAGEGASGLLSGDPALSPTLASSGTVAGMILGTAGYMSPEQMRGRIVDRRTDVWAFGVVLFELLTGRPLFAGDTITDLIAAVVTTEPDWSRLPPDTPAPVRRLLRRCLQRDPRLRLPDIGSARLELAELLAGVAEPDTGVTVTAPQGHRRPARQAARVFAWAPRSSSGSRRAYSSQAASPWGNDPSSHCDA